MSGETTSPDWNNGNETCNCEASRNAQICDSNPDSTPTGSGVCARDGVSVWDCYSGEVCYNSTSNYLEMGCGNCSNGDACMGNVTGSGYVPDGYCFSGSCCGDQSGENYIYCQSSSEAEYVSCDSSDDNCCDDSTDCVNSSGVCWNTDSNMTEGGIAYYCYNNVWYDPDENSSYCDGESYNGVVGYWAVAGELSVGEYSDVTNYECCGDDAGENVIACATSAEAGYKNCNSSIQYCCDASTDCVNITGTCFATASNITENGIGYYCYSSTWYDPDENSSYCDGEYYNNKRGYWDKAGEVVGEYTDFGSSGTQECCGDDPGENYVTCIDDSYDDACESDGNETACCNESTDCVYNNLCTTSGSGNTTSTLDMYCNAGTWEDPDENQTFCEAGGYASANTWISALDYNSTNVDHDSIGGGDCCGDDMDGNDSFWALNITSNYCYYCNSGTYGSEQCQQEGVVEWNSTILSSKCWADNADDDRATDCSSTGCVVTSNTIDQEQATEVWGPGMKNCIQNGNSTKGCLDGACDENDDWYYCCEGRECYYTYCDSDNSWQFGKYNITILTPNNTVIYRTDCNSPSEYVLNATIYDCDESGNCLTSRINVSNVNFTTIDGDCATGNATNKVVNCTYNPSNSLTPNTYQWNATYWKNSTSYKVFDNAEFDVYGCLKAELVNPADGIFLVRSTCSTPQNTTLEVNITDENNVPINGTTINVTISGTNETCT
ncbi:MAG: hypothetical protein ACTSPB_24225, partial [Candidatus Thorarchaeota archaeon]